MVKIRSIPLVAARFEADCELGAAMGCCQQARDFMAQSGLDKSELSAWELAIAEATSNAVKNCRPESRHAPVRVDVLIAPDFVEVRVKDQTPGFDWPDNAELPPDDSESGRGIFLIQSLTDESSYERGNGGNCLLLRKNRTGRQLPPSSSPAGGTKANDSELQHTLSLMTEELAASYESLSAVFRFSSELHAYSKSGDFVQRWLKELCATAEADLFVLRLYDEPAAALLLHAASSDEALLQSSILLNRPGSIEVRAANERNDCWFDASQPLAAADPLQQFAAGSIGFAHPLYAGETLLGVLTVGRKAGLGAFRAGQVNVIQTFGDFLALQIRNTQMQEDQVRSRLTAREVEIASDIQRGLLPSQLPAMKKLTLAGYYRSARGIGGDYYDVLPMPDGNLLLIIADVMGKGIPAALFTFMFRSLARSRIDLARDPGKLLAWLNQNLFAELDRAEMFMTAQIAYLDCRNEVIRLAGAGHPPMLLADDGGNIVELAGDGLPLGIKLAAEYPEVRQGFASGCAVIFTDGLHEARNAADELLGFGAIRTTLAAAARGKDSAKAGCARFAKLLGNFEGLASPADDTAFIFISHHQD